MTLDEKLKIIGIRWLPSADKSVLKLIKIAANRLAKLEAQLAFANATVSALRGQLESTTAERDAAQEREAIYTEYKCKLEAIVTWLAHHERGAFAHDLWDILYE